MKNVNYEAEAAIIGIVLVDGSLYHDLVIQEVHFHENTHRLIFKAMENVIAQDSFIDLVTVTTELGHHITDIGGTDYLLKLAESIASTAALKHYETLVIDAYRLRQARKQALQFINEPTETGLSKLIQQLQHYQMTGMSQDEKTLTDYLIDITADMCMSQDTTENSRYLTSIQTLDDMTGGLQKGELFVVAARPSVGKTAFALQLATKHAEAGGTSFVFSLEMGTKQLLQRMISSHARINSQKWRNMVFSTEDYERALSAIGDISEWRLFIYDTLRTVTSIRSAIRQHIAAQAGNRHLVVIDYLQLMTPGDHYERRELEIGAITRELKQLAVELDIPIVLLSQLSRSVDKRQDKRPLMSDLRESGNIEQDADVVSFLYRDDYYDYASKHTGVMEMILAKQRNGPTGTIQMAFNKENGRFENIQV